MRRAIQKYATVRRGGSGDLGSLLLRAQKKPDITAGFVVVLADFGIGFLLSRVASRAGLFKTATN